MTEVKYADSSKTYVSPESNIHINCTFFNIYCQLLYTEKSKGMHKITVTLSFMP